MDVVRLIDKNYIECDKITFEDVGVWLEKAKLYDSEEAVTTDLGKHVFIPFSSILYIEKQSIDLS